MFLGPINKNIFFANSLYFIFFRYLDKYKTYRKTYIHSLFYDIDVCLVLVNYLS